MARLRLLHFLYGGGEKGNRLTICYDENTWSFTRLATLDGVAKKGFLDVFGDGDVTVKLRVEWTE